MLPKVVAAEITMEAVRNTAVDIPKEIKTRRSYMDLYIAPRLVSIIRDARRSSYVSIQNETEFQIYCTGFNTKTGNWVCEPPGEIFPNELNVLFGNASGKKPQGCEAEVNFVAVTEDGSIPILLRCVAARQTFRGLCVWAPTGVWACQSVPSASAAATGGATLLWLEPAANGGTLSVPLRCGSRG